MPRSKLSWAADYTKLAHDYMGRAKNLYAQRQFAGAVFAAWDAVNTAQMALWLKDYGPMDIDTECLLLRRPPDAMRIVGHMQSRLDKDLPFGIDAPSRYFTADDARQTLTYADKLVRAITRDINHEHILEHLRRPENDDLVPRPAPKGVITAHAS